MPHPKNRLKLTGDTHLPDLGDLLDEAEDAELADRIDAAPRSYADGWEPPVQRALPAEHDVLPEPLAAVDRRVGRSLAATPWMAIAAALGCGFLLAKMLRRN